MKLPVTPKKKMVEAEKSDRGLVFVPISKCGRIGQWIKIEKLSPKKVEIKTQL